MKVKFYEKTDYEEFRKDFGEGSILHMEALRLFRESKQVSSRIKAMQFWCRVNFENLIEYNGFLTEV